MNQSFRFNVNVVSKDNIHNLQSHNKCAMTVGEIPCRVTNNCRWCTSGGCYTDNTEHDNLCSSPFIWLNHIKSNKLSKHEQDTLNSHSLNTLKHPHQHNGTNDKHEHLSKMLDNSRNTVKDIDEEDLSKREGYGNNTRTLAVQQPSNCQ